MAARDQVLSNLVDHEVVRLGIRQCHPACRGHTTSASTPLPKQALKLLRVSLLQYVVRTPLCHVRVSTGALCHARSTWHCAIVLVCMQSAGPRGPVSIDGLRTTIRLDVHKNWKSAMHCKDQSAEDLASTLDQLQLPPGRVVRSGFGRRRW